MSRIDIGSGAEESRTRPVSLEITPYVDAYRRRRARDSTEALRPWHCDISDCAPFSSSAFVRRPIWS
ncbi:unnamed protein product [Fusarium graminearum]|nr:unnamed protein product [Fusarium graminearum]CAG1983510.1 unnamed protein product [Fusarium graminearum]VTO90052.1 unnamed protein product [Fusarium graminearum]